MHFAQASQPQVKGHGRVLVRAYIMILKGDWPFLKVVCHFIRNWSGNAICWKCPAVLTGPRNMLMSNLDGVWRALTGQEPPWPADYPAAVERLPGFEHENMIEPDETHAFHLGSGRDLCATAIVILLTSGKFGPAGTRKSNCWRHLKGFCRTHRIGLVLKYFTIANLSWSRWQYPNLRCKASDVTAVLRWLASIAATPFSADPADVHMHEFPVMASMVWAANEFWHLGFVGNRFFTDAERELAHGFADLYLRSYIFLAAEALREGQLHWRIRPKFHLLIHIYLSVKSRPSGRNFHFNSVWMDEDFVGKIMRIMRRVHNRNLPRRTMQRYLLGLRGNLQPSVHRR